MMRIGLVAEVKWEVREVCRRLKLQLLEPRNGTWLAESNEHLIWLCLSGMVPAVSKERVTRFLDTTQLDLMMCSGLAGALKPPVRVGEIIVQSEDAPLVAIAERALKDAGISYHVGPLATVSRPVLTPTARRELATVSGGQSPSIWRAR